MDERHFFYYYLVAAEGLHWGYGIMTYRFWRRIKGAQDGRRRVRIGGGKDIMSRMGSDQFLKFLGHFFFVLCSALFFSACGSDTDEETAVLSVVTEAEYPPFVIGGESGEPKGFDVDIIRAIANVSGFRVVFSFLPFDEIIPALQESKFDIGIAAITITTERQKIVDFSQPYFETGQAIAVQKDNTDITDLESLKNRSIGVQAATTGAELAAGIEGAVISTYDTISQALQELANGTLDAVINDEASTRYAIKEGYFEGIKLAGELLTQEFYGITLPKGSKNLERINQGLVVIFEDGTYIEIYKKWFGTAPSKPPNQTPLKLTRIVGITVNQTS